MVIFNTIVGVNGGGNSFRLERYKGNISKTAQAKKKKKDPILVAFAVAVQKAKPRI